VLVNYTLITQS